MFPPPFYLPFPHMLCLQTLREAEALSAAAAATTAVPRLSEGRAAQEEPRSRVVDGLAAEMEAPCLREKGGVPWIGRGRGGD